VAENEFNNTDLPNQPGENRDPAAKANMPAQTNSKAKWIIPCVFISFVTIVFLTQRTAELNWIEDYQAGVEQAKKENKPLLMFFYENRYFGRFTKPMFENTFTDPETVEFIHDNFIPILVDVKKQPDIAEHFKYDYDPTSLVVLPETEEVVQISSGWLPGSYIDWMQKALAKIQQQNK